MARRRKSAAEAMYPTAKTDDGLAVNDNNRNTNVKLRQRCEARFTSLDSERYSWWTHWSEIAKYILPRRYVWLTTNRQNSYERGAPINQAILDNTATRAARNCSAGMMAGITSPSRPWFRLTSPDKTIADDPDVKLWLEEVQSRMLRVMATSNYYVAKHTQYFDLVVFGTAPMLIYEDKETVIRCYNPCAGEYYVASGPKLSINTFAREFPFTVAQCVEEYGLENCSQTVKSGWTTRGAMLDQEVTIRHLIEPNPEFVEGSNTVGDSGLMRSFKFREVYYERNAQAGKYLRIQGFFVQPFSCPRWDVASNDSYGRSPGMDALGDVKQLQLEQKRKAQAIDKFVNPPMVADVSMKNEPASLLPGGVTYTTQIGQAGFKPVYHVMPQLQYMLEDIQDVQGRIRDTFYNDLFLMISQFDPKSGITATEIDARREEKLIMLEPVLERNEIEGLSPDILRIFNIMMRGGLLPPPPPAIARTRRIKVEYISILAEAQRAVATTGIERLYVFAGNISAPKLASGGPTALDNLDDDETMKQYSNLLSVNPKIMKDPRKVAELRAQRQEAQAAAVAAQAGMAATQGAKTLSETDVGGGTNALQMMLQGTGGPL